MIRVRVGVVGVGVRVVVGMRVMGVMRVIVRVRMIVRAFPPLLWGRAGVGVARRMVDMVVMAGVMAAVMLGL
jgi:hypothetical protein